MTDGLLEEVKEVKKVKKKRGRPKGKPRKPRKPKSQKSQASQPAKKRGRKRIKQEPKEDVAADMMNKNSFPELKSQEDIDRLMSDSILPENKNDINKD